MRHKKSERFFAYLDWFKSLTKERQQEEIRLAEANESNLSVKPSEFFEECRQIIQSNGGNDMVGTVKKYIEKEKKND